MSGYLGSLINFFQIHIGCWFILGSLVNIENPLWFLLPFGFVVDFGLVGGFFVIILFVKFLSLMIDI